jgi:alkanesulfonate monooxygenase SsuD/methylene tetrahydromethanopterin reductase-like flavin-dependent oxidoreductase (luciferase family)
MPGVMPILGQSRAEANEHFEQLQSSIHPTVGLSLLADMLGGADLSGYPLDEPFPEQLPETLGNKSRVALLTEMARRDKLTVRQLYTRIAGARGHWTVIGTPADVADQIEERFVKHGADGFNLMPAYLPGSLNDVVDLVVPQLQRRGLFRHDYQGRTLRDNLGLPRPLHPAQSNR